MSEHEAELLFKELRGDQSQVAYADFEKWMLEVKRMNILSTTFLKMDTNEDIVYPTSVLATKPIENLKGSPDPSDYLELSLDCSTTMSKIDELKSRIER
ncbi:hypothetical protein Ancab_034954 [Ancistrocladus abbreviatus]